MNGKATKQIKTKQKLIFHYTRGFKALKQIVKLQFTLGKYDKVLQFYEKLLNYAKSAVSRSISEKAINSLIEKLSNATDKQLIEKFYDATLDMLKETKNERFWFKTKLRVGKYKFEQEEYDNLSKVK